MEADQANEVLNVAGLEEEPPVQEPAALEEPAEELPAEPEAPAISPADVKMAALEAQVNQLQHMLAAQQQPMPQAAPEPEPAPEPPDPTTTSPQDYVNFFVQQALKQNNDAWEKRFTDLQQSISPIKQREAFTNAYHTVAREMGVNGKELGPVVGKLLEDPSYSDLVEIAETNPTFAARQFIRMAQLQKPAPAPAAARQKRAAPRPTPRPTGHSAPSRGPAKIPMSFGEAFADTFTERGVPSDAAVTFTTDWAASPAAEG
ncbi:MAG: hypothetical protein CMH39_00340 [Micrococcales bacterium]|nr:hypothetical protein [Micrococcales bacterium]